MPTPPSSFEHSTFEKDPRIYFAAERTFLAWLRTGLGLMGVGFAVSRFGLISENPLSRAARLAGDGGLMLVILGVLVNLGAALQHVRVVRELCSGAWKPGIARGAVALALLLAGVGIALAVILTLR